MDDADYDRLSNFRWRLHSGGYVVRSVWLGGRNHSVYMHREIINPPDGMVIDHKNRNKTDNRRSNLRVCTQNENLCNSIRRAGQYKGVYQDLNNSPRFFASITKGRKTVNLGSYGSAEEAARAYDKAAKELHGEFARLNFI